MSKILTFSLVLVAFISGIGVGYVLTPGYKNYGNMGSNMMTNDEMNFINGMIEHHMGAIEMAKQANEKSTRQDIKDLAEKIILAQTDEIEMLYAWKRDWYGDKTTIIINEHDNSMNMMKDLGESDEKFNLRFLEAMIEHHQGAVKMSEEILGKTERKEIDEFAKKVIEDQSKEIEMMKQWKEEELYGKE